MSITVEQTNREALYEALRFPGGMQYTSLHGHEGWYVTSYELVKKGMRLDGLETRIPSPSVELARLQKEMVLFQNGKKHIELRGPIMQGFAPRVIRSFEPWMETVARSLVQQFPKGEPFDFVKHFSFPLTVRVIARLLGIKIPSEKAMQKLSRALLATVDMNRDRETLNEGKRAFFQLEALLKEVIEEPEIAEEGTPFALLYEEVGRPNGWSKERLLSTLLLLFIAGQETTTHLISSTVAQLLQDDALKDEWLLCDVTSEQITEEALRFFSPTQIVGRVARKDVSLGSETVRRGQSVYFVLAAANRDEKKFPLPDRFIPSRDTKGHVAFGADQHFCIGSYLAKTETAIALTVLREEAPTLKMCTSPVWRELVGFRAVESFEVIQ